MFTTVLSGGKRDKDMDQSAQENREPQSTDDRTRPVWDNAEQLSKLRDRASHCGDRLSQVLFQASLQTLEDQQQAMAYRQRVTEALLESADTVTPVGEIDIETKAVELPLHEHHLQAPPPVSLYEDPLKYRFANPTSIANMSHEDQDQIAAELDQSRESAILMTEAHHELFRPLLGLAACIALILFIGAGVYFKGKIASPRTVTASPMTQQSEQAPTRP